MATVQDTRCLQVFRKVDVDHLVRGTTRVSWELGRNFRDPAPHTFQLQVGRTGLTTADDWADVGVAANDVFFADDGAQRIFGKTFWTHYRVVLTTPVATYHSQPAAVLGRMTPRDARLAREILRKERLRNRLTAENGYILKRRLYGAPCDCVDELTQEARDSDCENCFGTGIISGFFAALPDQYVDTSLEQRHEQTDVAARGTTNQMAVTGRYSGGVQLNENDAWVHRSSDRRFYVHSVSSLTEVSGVPIIVQLELREAPATDPIYDVPLG